MVHNHRKQGAAVTLMLAPVPLERRGDFGTVLIDGLSAGAPAADRTFGRITEFREKDPNSPSKLNNASCYLIEGDVLAELENRLTAADPDLALSEPVYDFGQHVFPGMLLSPKVPHLHGVLGKHKERLFGFVFGRAEGDWFDVGNKRDYLAVNEAVLDGRIDAVVPYQRLPWGWLGFRSNVDFREVNIIAPVIIGNECNIMDGATIGPYAVIGDGWTVREKTQVSYAVLWENYDRYRASEGYASDHGPREIGPGVTVRTAIIVGGNVTRDVIESTADYKPGENATATPIDHIPAAPRA